MLYTEWCTIDSIGNYLLNIVGAAIICGVLTSVISGKTGSGAVIRTLSGIFLTITILSPIFDLSLTDLSSYLDDMQIDAQLYVQDGLDLAQTQKNVIIKEQLEAYISDKAKACGCEVRAVITISESQEVETMSVELSGAVSPYNKKVISRMITDDLGIPEDKQIWK